MSLQFALVLLRSSFISCKKRRKSVLLRRSPWSYAEGGWSCMLSFSLGRTITWRKIGSFTVVFKSCIVMVMYQSNRNFNMPHPPVHFNFWKIFVQIPLLGPKSCSSAPSKVDFWWSNAHTLGNLADSVFYLFTSFYYTSEAVYANMV